MVKFKTHLPLYYSPIFEIPEKSRRTAFYEFCEKHEMLFLNRKELSKKTGICPSQLSRLFNSEIVPSKTTLLKFSNAFPLNDSEREELLSCSGDWGRFWSVIKNKLREMNLKGDKLYTQMQLAHISIYKQKLSYCLANNSKPSFALALAFCVICNKDTKEEDRIKNAEQLLHYAGYSFSGSSKIEFIKECIYYGYSNPSQVNTEYEDQIRQYYFASVA